MRLSVLACQLAIESRKAREYSSSSAWHDPAPNLHATDSAPHIPHLRKYAHLYAVRVENLVLWNHATSRESQQSEPIEICMGDGYVYIYTYIHTHTSTQNVLLELCRVLVTRIQHAETRLQSLNMVPISLAGTHAQLNWHWKVEEN